MDLVVGGTGFIGQALLRRMPTGSARVLTRDPAKAARLKQSGHEAVVGDLLAPETLGAACAGASHVYHLGQVYFQQRTGRNTHYAPLEIEATRNLLVAAREARVSQVIYLGILGTRPDAKGFGRTRWEVEELLRASGVPVTILRAGTVVGLGGYGFRTLFDTVRRWPVVFYLGPGTQRDQPLWIEDMVTYLLAVRGQPWALDRTFDCGGDTLTYTEMVDQIGEVLGRRPLKIALPPALMAFAARWLQGLLPYTAGVAADAVATRTEDTMCSETAIRELVPLEVLSFREGVRRVAQALHPQALRGKG